VESFDLVLIFFKTAERPEEAPASSLEKTRTKRELATNSWNRHIILFIIENGRTNKTFIKFVLLAFYMCK
jgi:hypothetical protein